MRNILSHKIVVYIGWISYPIYLWHWLLLSLYVILNNGDVSFPSKLFLLISTALCASLTFHFVELDARAKKPTKNLLITLVSTLSLISAISASINKTDGFPLRLGSDKSQLLSLVKTSLPDNKYSCLLKKGFSCYTSRVDKDPDVIFIGDSHMLHMTTPILKNTPSHIVANVYPEERTLPIDDWVIKFSNSQLARDTRMHKALEHARNSKASMVVFSNFWGLWGLGTQRYSKMLDGTYSTMEQALEKTVSSFVYLNKKIVFLIDTATMKNDMSACMKLRPFNWFHVSCNISKQEYEKQVSLQREVFLSLKRKFPNNVYIVEAGRVLCNKQFCSMKNSAGEPFYSDSNHLTRFATEEISRYVWKELGKFR